jgi:hypothetical protein
MQTYPAVRAAVTAVVAERQRVLREWVEDAVTLGEMSIDFPPNALAALLLAISDGLALAALRARSARVPLGEDQQGGGSNARRVCNAAVKDQLRRSSIFWVACLGASSRCLTSLGDIARDKVRIYFSQRGIPRAPLGGHPAE